MCVTFSPLHVGPNTSPHPQGISPGLQRARRPFLVRNILTGLTISAFVVGVWAYSISAVKQDVFDDVDAEARALSPATRAATESVEDRERATKQALTKIAATAPERWPNTKKQNLTSPVPATKDGYIGILGRALGDRYPWLYDPSKGLVYGAPSVDDIGRMSDSRRD
jgi:cytochrome c oxidase assembly factor 3